METLFFYIFGIIALSSATMMVVSRNPVHSALFLILTFFSLAGLYILLDAHFLAAIQVMVYAGAIMVLFLFVIMLLNLNVDNNEFKNYLHLKIVGAGSAVMMIFMVLYLINKGVLFAGSAAQAAGESNTEMIGKVLFTDYVLPFEIASVLLIVAIIGAVVLAKKTIRE